MNDEMINANVHARSPAYAENGTAVSGALTIARRYVVLLWVAFILLMAWYATGAIPFGASHGDAVQEAAGVEHIAHYGWDGPLLTHNFVGCPGLTTTLLLLRRLTGIAPISLLGGVSLISGLVFTLAAAGLISRLTAVPVPLAGLVLLLSPVAVMAGMYPNDLITAAAVVGLALFLLAGPMHLRNQLAGAICLGVAGWYRADAIMITAAIPFILYRGDWKATLRAVAVVGCVSACIALGLVYASGSNLPAIVSHARYVSDNVGQTAMFVAFYASFFPIITLYLLVLGVKQLMMERAWRIMGMVVLGTVPLWYVLATIPMPKHFTYVVPWFAVIYCFGLRSLLGSVPNARRRFHLAALALLFVGQYVCGLQISLRDKPWRKPSGTALITVVQTELAKGPISDVRLVIGPGTFNPFGHAGAPISGILFTPMEVSREQRTSRRYLADCTAYVGRLTATETKFFGSTHGGVQSAIYGLVNSGFRCVSKEPLGPRYTWRYTWVRGEQRVVQYSVFTPEYESTYLRSIGEVAGTYFFGSGREEASILAQAESAKLITREEGQEISAIYEVTFSALDTTSNGTAQTP